MEADRSEPREPDATGQETLENLPAVSGNPPRISYPPPAPPAGDRLRTIRTMVVAVVVMWVVLVGAWAINRGLAQAAFADQERRVEEARLRLASVEDLSNVFTQVNTVMEPSVVKIDTFRGSARPGPRGQVVPQANSGSGVAHWVISML